MGNTSDEIQLSIYSSKETAWRTYPLKYPSREQKHVLRMYIPVYSDTADRTAVLQIFAV